MGAANREAIARELLEEAVRRRIREGAIQKALEVLNEALEADPDAVNVLFKYRTLCSETLADHPSIQVSLEDMGEKYSVGVLGFINGLFGVDESEDGFIDVVLDGTKARRIVGFVQKRPPQEKAATDN